MISISQDFMIITYSDEVLLWINKLLLSFLATLSINFRKMPLFSSGKKSPVELVKTLHDALNIMSKEHTGKKNEKVITDKFKMYDYDETLGLVYYIDTHTVTYLFCVSY